MIHESHLVTCHVRNTKVEIFHNDDTHKAHTKNIYDYANVNYVKEKGTQYIRKNYHEEMALM
jgi:hypothetical protein